jgi:hypothetical protein
VGIQIRHPSKDKDGKIDHKGFPVPPIQLYAQAAEVRDFTMILMHIF